MIYIMREAPTSKLSPCLTSHPLWPAGGFAEQQHVCIRAAGLWQCLLLDYSLRDMRRCTIMMKRVSSNAAAFGSMVMHNAQPKAVMLQRAQALAVFCAAGGDEMLTKGGGGGGPTGPGGGLGEDGGRPAKNS